MIMPKRDTSGLPTSRDYSLPVIKCDVVCCPCCCNRECIMPSAIEIGPNGVCSMGKKSLNSDT